MLLRNNNTNPVSNAIEKILVDLLKQAMANNRVDQNTANTIYNEIHNFIPQLTNQIETQYPNGIDVNTLTNIVRDLINRTFNAISSTVQQPQFAPTNTGFFNQNPINQQTMYNPNPMFTPNRYGSSLFSSPTNQPSNIHNQMDYGVDTGTSQPSQNVNQNITQFNQSVSNTIASTTKEPSTLKRKPRENIPIPNDVTTDKGLKVNLVLDNGIHILTSDIDFKVIKEDNISLIEDKSLISKILMTDVNNINIQSIKTIDTKDANNETSKYTRYDFKIDSIYSFLNHDSNVWDIIDKISLIDDNELFNLVSKANKLKIQNKKIIKVIEYNEYLVISNHFKELIENSNTYIDLIDKSFITSKYDEYIVKYINTLLSSSLRYADAEKIDKTGSISEINDISDMLKYFDKNDMSVICDRFFSNISFIVNKNLIYSNDKISVIGLPVVMIMLNYPLNKLYNGNDIILMKMTDYLDKIIDDIESSNNILPVSIIDNNQYRIFGCCLVDDYNMYYLYSKDLDSI